MFTMLSSIAEFENELRRERQSDGILLAKSRGIELGRKSKLSSTQVSEMKIKRESGIKIKDLMSEYSLSKASVYRLMTV